VLSGINLFDAENISINVLDVDIEAYVNVKPLYIELSEFRGLF
jgi:hypothetical protein